MNTEITIDRTLKSLIRPLGADEYSALEASIASDGCRDALVIWKERSVLLDGHNRYEICQRLGKPFKTTALPFKDRLDAEVWMLTNQAARRNLSDDERACYAKLLEDKLTEQAKRDRASKGGVAKEAKKKGCLEAHVTSKQSKKSESGRSRKTAARIAKVSEHKVRAARKVSESSPELFAKVATGEIPLRQAVREVKKKAYAERTEAAKAKPLQVPVGPFDLILADPPWRYDDATPNREIENHYDTATVDEIIKHRPSSAADTCVLLMWATAPKLLEALKVMEGWGFTYRTHAIWDKQKIGMGYWFRGQHELLLVGVKGKAKTPVEQARRSSIFSEPRGKHSAKPVCVYEWIEAAFPESQKLEMYCRSPREGWAAWGNE